MVERQDGAIYMGMVEDGRVLVWNYKTNKSYLVGAGMPDEEVDYHNYPLAASPLPKGMELDVTTIGINKMDVALIFRVRRLHWACPMHIRPGRDMTPARKRPYKINLNKGA